MKKIKYLQLVAIFLSSLIVMLPVCFADTLNLIYDDNGNLVTGDGNYRVYNSLNQLWKVYNGTDTTGTLLQEFTYHPTEERVLIKNVSNTTGDWKETVYYISKDLVRIVNITGTFDITYIYHEGQLVAERNHEGTKTFYHPDHLGSTSLVTDENGDLVEETFYSPYGVILSGGTASRFDYEGKEFDSAINQYDFHFRGYKAEWGIFTQPDTLLPNMYDPQQLNRYSFERGNPWKNVDESGHMAFVVGLIIIGIAIYSGYQLAKQLTAIEKAEGSLTQKDFTLALLNVALIVSPTSGLGQVITKFSGKQVYKSYFDKRIENLEQKGEDCEGPLCKKDQLPKIEPPQPIQDSSGGSSSTSGSGTTSSGSTGGDSSGGTGGGGECVPSCSTSCHKTHDGGLECHQVCTVCN